MFFFHILCFFIGLFNASENQGRIGRNSEPVTPDPKRNPTGDITNQKQSPIYLKPPKLPSREDRLIRENQALKEEFKKTVEGGEQFADDFDEMFKNLEELMSQKRELELMMGEKEREIAQLQNDKRELENRLLCPNCFEREKSVAAQACGHLFACLECANAVYMRDPRCPICSADSGHLGPFYH